MSAIGQFPLLATFVAVPASLRQLMQSRCTSA